MRKTQNCYPTIFLQIFQILSHNKSPLEIYFLHSRKTPSLITNNYNQNLKSPYKKRQKNLPNNLKTTYYT